MEYLGKDIPKLGFGLMRLPMLGEEVDLEQTKQMVDKFLEAGFTYFDTAYGYLGGKSEEAVKTALVDRYPRESFQLATKLPAWAGAQTAGEAKEMLQTSLRRTGAGYFDFYLLHNCGDDRTQAFDKFGIWDYALEMKEKGLLKHVGFSFHDKADVLDELLSGMSTLEQMEQNLATMKEFSPLSAQEQAVVAQAREALASLPSIPCTSCQYCVKGCPQGIPIPGVFSAMNTHLIYGNTERAKGNYGFATRGKGKASDCIQCGQCESVCPQHISIIQQLQQAAEVLE